jgi:hypothetical protein
VHLLGDLHFKHQQLHVLCAVQPACWLLSRKLVHCRSLLACLPPVCLQHG